MLDQPVVSLHPIEDLGDAGAQADRVGATPIVLVRRSPTDDRGAGSNAPRKPQR